MTEAYTNQDADRMAEICEMLELGVGPEAAAEMASGSNPEKWMPLDGWAIVGRREGQECYLHEHHAWDTLVWEKVGCPRVYTLGTCCGCMNPEREED